MHSKPSKYDNSGVIPPSSRKRPESRYSRQDQFSQSPNAIVTPSSTGYSSNGNTPIDFEEEKESGRRHRDRPSSTNSHRYDVNDGNKYK